MADDEFIGRERECAQLASPVAEALAGHGSLVLLAGEAGVGKTTLVRRVLARSGLTVLEGFATAGGASPFGPLVEALRAYLRSPAYGPLIEGPLAAHLALLLPELGPAAGEGDPATLFEAIRLAVATIAARQPTALFLDDLQWADDATLELLPALARTLPEQPLLMLAAYRSDELPRTHPIRRMRSELRRSGHLRQLVVEPLDAEATAALVDRTLGSAAPTLRRAVFDRTDGIPLYVAELAAALAASGRLQSGPAGLELVDGTDVPLPDSVRDAVLLHFKVVGKRRWPAGNAPLRHLRRPMHPGDAATERLAAAAHLRSAGSFRAALNLLKTAGQQARDAQRVDLQARILGQEGNVLARMGQGQQGVELTRAGLAMALEHGLAGPAAEIYQRLADSLEHAGDYVAASATYDEAYSFCSANGLEPTAQLCMACLTAVLRQSGDWDRAVTLCQQVIESSQATVHARAVATGMLGSIFGLRGRTRQARPLLLESATLARQIELAAMEFVSGWGLAVVDSVEGATQSAAGHCWALLERWKQTEDRHFAMPPIRWATTFFAESGDAAGTRPAPRRSPRSPPMPATTRRCPRSPTDWAKRRSLIGASIRPPINSPGRWYYCRATMRHSNGRSHNAGWRPCSLIPAVATRPSSISSPRTGQLGVWAQGHWQISSPAPSVRWGSGLNDG